MGPGAIEATILPGYVAAREGLAHRIRLTAILDVVGEDRIAFLQGQLTQEMRALAPGESRPVAGLTPKGKLLFLPASLGLPDRIRLARARGLRALDARAPAQVRRVHERSRSRIAPGTSRESGSTVRRARGLAPPDGRRSASRARATSRRSSSSPSRRHARDRGAPRRRGLREVSEETAEILRVEAGRPRFGVGHGRVEPAGRSGHVRRDLDVEGVLRRAGSRRAAADLRSRQPAPRRIPFPGRRRSTPGRRCGGRRKRKPTRRGPRRAGSRAPSSRRYSGRSGSATRSGTSRSERRSSPSTPGAASSRLRHRRSARS